MKKDIAIFSFLTGAIFITGMLTGRDIGRSVESCRNVVLRDIQQHQAYDAELAKLVSADFLTAMTKGK